MQKFILPFCCIVLITASCSTKKTENTSNKISAQTSSNIIFMVGDGMGLSQVSSAFYYGDSEPNFVRFPHIGLSRTSSSSHKITDSAAGATAFSAGKKTYNGAIAMDTDSVTPLKTIVETLSEKGWNTGLISTSSITHATPASFFANAKVRKMEDFIASQMHASGVDFFAGGGLQFFAKRRDGKNYLDSLVDVGFQIDTTGAMPVSDVNKKYGYLLADIGLPKMSEGRGDFLPDFTAKALQYFEKKEEPFFLMVEGSQIDWGGHANDGDYIVQETLDFDKTIGIALDYAQKIGNTIVVVTADHETGGFTLRGKEKLVPFRGKKIDYNDLDFGFSSGSHSATMVPVFAYGVGTEVFSGVYQNNTIYDKLMSFVE